MFSLCMPSQYGLLKGSLQPQRIDGSQVVSALTTLPFAIAIMAMLIITVGGTIRIYDAGESCPDWPKCFGTWGFDISEEDQGEWYGETEEYDSRGLTSDTLPLRSLLNGYIAF